MGWKTANCINYEDTAGRQLQEGFNNGFEEAGGKIVSTQFVPIDAVDFSSYLTSLKDADCTYWWIFGNGAAPFVKQYKDYGLTAPLITAMAEQPHRAAAGGPRRQRPRPHRRRVLHARDRQPAEQGVRRRRTRRKYDGEYPTMQSFGAWLAVNLFAGAVEAHRRRHHTGQAHRGHVERDHRHAGRPRTR